MQFTKVIGDIKEDKLKAAERILTEVFFELALNPTFTNSATKLGGDPFFYALISNIEHVATNAFNTAATNGAKFYWNPDFVLKLSKVGVRIVACHEALHANYMHVNRRGGREPKLWNLAVDYMVHRFIIDDFATRVPPPENSSFSKERDGKMGKEGAALLFKKHLGDYITIDDFHTMVHKSKSVNDFPPEFQNRIKDLLSNGSDKLNLPSPDITTIDDDLKKKIERREARKMTFYMDPNIPEELATAEKVYEKLKKLKDDAASKFGKDIADAMFDMGDLVDEHFDSEVSESEMEKRIYDAMQVAKQAAGATPAGMEGELEQLSQPVLRWQDRIRSFSRKIQDGSERSDWTRFKSRHLMFGVLTPKKLSYRAHFHALCDTSGSMGDDDIAFAVSQIAAFKDVATGVLVPADADVYWDHKLVLDKCTQENLRKFKVQGRGGTVFKAFFENHEKELGKSPDFLLILTDGYLCADDYVKKPPKMPVFWIITAHNPDFNPPFGKVYHLYNDRL